MAHRSDRRGATPITRLAVRGRASDWHPARGFHDGPEPNRLHGRGRRYDCSPTIVPRSGDDDRHGAPRASRPCGRLRRCASRSLDPCSRRGLSTATRRRPSLRRLPSTGGLRSFSLDAFYLTEESRYRVRPFHRFTHDASSAGTARRDECSLQSRTATGEPSSTACAGLRLGLEGSG